MNLIAMANALVTVPDLVSVLVLVSGLLSVLASVSGLVSVRVSGLVSFWAATVDLKTLLRPEAASLPRPGRN